MQIEARILIVDHDENVLIGLERTLEDAGYSTATAWSREEALLLSDRASFDLLLIDEYVGDLDSAMLLGQLRRSHPSAAFLLMHTRRGSPGKRLGWTQAAVCKWEHDEVMARVRDCLAA